MSPIDVKKYWENRLKIFCNLEGVGYLGLGKFFNHYLYKAKVRSIERIVKKYSISFKNKDVLDIGSGIGFWIDYYLKKGAKTIYGIVKWGCNTGDVNIFNS